MRIPARPLWLGGDFCILFEVKKLYNLIIYKLGNMNHFIQWLGDVIFVLGYWPVPTS